MNIDERIKQGEEKIKEALAAIAKKNREAQYRIEEQWAEAYAKLKELLPEDIHQYIHVPEPERKPGAGSEHFSLVVPGITEILIMVDFRWNGRKDYNLVGLEKQPFVVGEYIVGWNRVKQEEFYLEEHAVEVAFESFRTDDLDTALAMAKRNQAKFGDVKRQVDEKNERLRQKREQPRRSTDELIADMVRELVSMAVKSYEEPPF